MNTEQSLQMEQQRVDQVIENITARAEELQERAGILKMEVVEIRKHFWDDVTVNLSDPEEAAESVASMRQQAEVLQDRERSHLQAQSQLNALIRLQAAPYFGRFDFQEQGESETESVYVGTSSFQDDSGLRFLIYDWRAPVSSLYYDYAPGPAQYETPGGTIQGEMTLKRQFIIRDGVIRSMFDTGVTIGDELLQEVLGKQSDNQMRSIVATIQREQNRIIRNEKGRLLIVQGAAGSGKTSAALQRVAYLLYRFRGTLSADQIVLFSPNPMFNSYVSTVLPELGEQNMQQATYQEYLERRLGSGLRVEDPFEQMEYVLSAMEEPGYDARMEGIRFKAAVSFMGLIDRYADCLGTQGLRFRDIRFRGQVLIPASVISEQFYKLDASLRIPNRMQMLAEWLLKELHSIAKQEREKPWVDDEIELMDKEEYLEAFEQLQKKKRFSEKTFDDFDRERSTLAKMVVQREFKPLRAAVKRLGFLDLPEIYLGLYEDPQFGPTLAEELSFPEQWAEICRQTADALGRKELPYEDATPFLYLMERLEGFQTNNKIRHVFIDEAQDYSPFQFAVIKRFFPFSKMTVLGDPNQGIFAHAANEKGFGSLVGMYGEDETETYVLTRSYRSTRQIVEFTRGLIQGGEEIELFNRNGRKPTWTDASDEADLTERIAERIRMLQEEGHRTIAVICKTVQESRDVYEALKEKLSVRLIGTGTSSFEKGTLVIPSYLAKGVEFDGVILYNASRERYGRESERRLFYTACTRAMHELHLFSIGERTPFLDGVDPETYESKEAVNGV